jgi:hypothetical protein
MNIVLSLIVTSWLGAAVPVVIGLVIALVDGLRVGGQ